MCGGGGSGSNDDRNMQNPTPKKSRNNIINSTGYDPTLNTNPAPINGGTTGTNTGGAIGNAIASTVKREAPRAALYAINPGVGLGVDIVRGLAGFFNPDSQKSGFGYSPAETVTNIVSGGLPLNSAKNIATKAALSTAGSMASGRMLPEDMRQNPNTMTGMAGNFTQSLNKGVESATSMMSGTTKKPNVGTIGSNVIPGSTRNDTNVKSLEENRNKGFGRGFY
tara:strand:- start:10525 stop:11193 length:669 start_codon:yes stop_codon:yes gene_type:complete